MLIPQKSKHKHWKTSQAPYHGYQNIFVHLNTGINGIKCILEIQYSQSTFILCAFSTTFNSTWCILQRTKTSTMNWRLCQIYWNWYRLIPRKGDDISNYTSSFIFILGESCRYSKTSQLISHQYRKGLLYKCVQTISVKFATEILDWQRGISSAWWNSHTLWLPQNNISQIVPMSAGCSSRYFSRKLSGQPRYELTHFYTPVWKTDVLCYGNVRPSVRPSEFSGLFFQHALRYQFETWYMHSVGGTTCRVWVSSQLGHFDLVYSQK